MARVLVTGMSGVGKSSVLAALGRRGHLVVDTDHGGWKAPDGTWHLHRVAALLDQHPTVCVSGTVDNQGELYPRFDHVVVMVAPLEVLLERLRTRTGNPYGRSAADQAEVARYVEEVEPLLLRGATTVLDGRESLVHLVDAVEALLLAPPRPDGAGTR